MEKCKNCNLKKIKTIIFHEFEFQKCYTCSYVRIFKNDFYNFINLVKRKYNVGNIKKYDSTFNCNEYELKLINDFDDAFKKFDILTNKSNKFCDFCTEELEEIIFYKKLKGFYCKECNSFYFLQNEFNNFLDFLIKDLRKRNYFLNIKVIFKNKLRKYILKIKEIFLHRRKKNNVKK